MLTRIERYIKENKQDIIIIFILILIASFFRFYELEHRFLFEWDQERDANVVWEIVKEKNITLIGPRAVGATGFFLGPLWYYILAPFYFLTGMDPIGAAIFASLAGIITTVALYLFSRYFFSEDVALLISMMWSVFSERLAWNPMLLPIFTLLILFFSFKIILGDKKYIPWVFLTWGLSLHIHFQAVFYIFSILFSLFVYYCKKRTIPKNIITGVGLFGSTFLPIILFDIKHNFLNLKAFLHFFFQPSTPRMVEATLLDNFSYALDKFLLSYASIIPQEFINKHNLGLILLIMTIIGILWSRLRLSLKILFFVGIFAPVIAFSIYRGEISEYYFSITIIPLMLGMVIFLTNLFHYSQFGKYITILLVTYFFLFHIAYFFPYNLTTSLYHKKQVVKSIINHTGDTAYNVSYSVPMGQDNGFRYLFKYYGEKPQDIPGIPLWTVVIPPEGENVPPLETYGDIGIIKR